MSINHMLPAPKILLWSGLWKNRMRKKLSIDKKLFLAGRQEFVSDAIVALANIITLLEFITDDSNQSEPPMIIKNLRQLSKLLYSAKFTKFAKKNRVNITMVHLCHCVPHPIDAE